MLDQEQDSSATNSSTTEEPKKRNSGKTGPTSEAGRARSSQNAYKHGACSKVLIMHMESNDDYLELLERWQDLYPTEEPVIADFVIKVVHAEWSRLRAQEHFDEFLHFTDGQAPFKMHPLHKHDFELMQRYLTAAERKFQRELNQLEKFYKIHTELEEDEDEENEEDEPEPTDNSKINFVFMNNDTGETQDMEGNLHPPPSDFVHEPIVPGVYPPDHPSHRPPRDFRKKKKKRKGKTRRSRR
jgi:hypothetical protein